MRFIFVSLIFLSSVLSASEFTISTYNCGGLSEHYDYLRAACMQKVMQERYNAEPETMALNEEIQKLALKIRFSNDPQEKQYAQRQWDRKNYTQLFKHLSSSPLDPNSPNTTWNQKTEQSISSYRVRPVVISDEEVTHMLHDHCRDLSQKEGSGLAHLTDVRATMAKRIFAHHLKYDIICLQEADYLHPSMFPENYATLFSDTSHSINGVAWNTKRFELVESLGNLMSRAYAIHLRDKESGKTVLVASGHITGCDPYCVHKDENGTLDSTKGDAELQAIVDLFKGHEADLKLIGMDSNVTSLHPRLNILKDGGYNLDYKHHLEPTCANPHQVLNTRIDWIALKADCPASVKNIPVLGVCLNSIQTNMSDHKPIAAKIVY